MRREKKRWQRHGSLSRERTERDRRCGCASVGRYVSTINILLREFPSILCFWSDVFNKIRIETSILVSLFFFFFFFLDFPEIGNIAASGRIYLQLYRFVTIAKAVKYNNQY